MKMSFSMMLAPVVAILFALPLRAACDDVDSARFPDADSVIVDMVDDTEYRPDGTYRTESFNKIKVLTEKGRRSESVITLGYNARYGTARILEVLVESSDGSVRNIDLAKTTKESTDNSSVSANIYDPLDRQIVCTVPGLKVGDVITYRTERKTFMSRVKDHFADVNVMEWTCPILSQKIVIKAPGERPLRKMVVRHPLGNVGYSSSTNADGSVVHTWTVKDSPQAFSEPDMPPLYKQVQNMQVSTVGSWPELSKWYWDLSLPHLSKTTPAITNCVSAIVSALGKDADEMAKISAIYKWVAQEIRYMGLTMEETSPGYAPHDVDITFDNRYGVCRDKAALLVAMLRIAGFEAYPVLIHAGAKMDEEVPLPYFNHAITAVRAPGSRYANRDGYILMDATNETSRDIMPAYLGDRSYLVAAPYGEKLLTSGVPSAESNGLFVIGKGTLEKDGSMIVESEIDFRGISDNIYRRSLLRRKPDERRTMFERIVASVSSSAELIAFELEPADLRRTEVPLKAKIAYRVNEVLLRGEDEDRLMVPQLSRAMGAVNWILDGATSLEKRRFPLVVSSTAMVDEKLDIRLGDDLGAVKSLPEAFSIPGAYSYLRSYSVKDGVLTFRRNVALNAVEFSSEGYADLRESLKRFESVERHVPVFAKNRRLNSNVHYRNIENLVNVTAPGAWVVTNVCEKEILTYDGKKNSAELKFSFNPAWKNVEVLKAEVVNRDGSRSVASDREKTVLDCGWAASAPRYPATKELIVNLPSVEIGSVIRYVTVTTVTNSPLPFYASWNFESADSVGRMLVDYRDFKGERYVREAKDLKRIPSEPMQAARHTWCDVKTISLGDFASAARRLRKAADVEPDGFGKTLVAGIGTLDGKIEAIRNWMALNVKVAGPGMYELPLERQLTAPAKVLEERYASYLDYIRTMCALMKGAGLDADIVFAANDANAHRDDVYRDVHEHPYVGRFGTALCRINVKRGFFGFGGREPYAFVGGENEYAPLHATPFMFSSYLDPADGEIRHVSPCGKFKHRNYQRAQDTVYRIFVRENGAVDIDYSHSVWGPQVGAQRKHYAEILPEDKNRYFQELLGSLSQAATSTSDLVADVKSYPFTVSFRAFVPGYATVSGDSIMLSLPEIGSRLFGLTGSVRKTPIEISGSQGHGRVKIEVVLPEGYTELEHLPESFDVKIGERLLRSFSVKVDRSDAKRVCVVLEEKSFPGFALRLPREQFPLLKEYSRFASARGNKTIVARKKAK